MGFFNGIFRKKGGEHGSEIVSPREAIIDRIEAHRQNADSPDEVLVDIADREPIVRESWSQTYHGQADVAPSILKREKVLPAIQEALNQEIKWKIEYGQLFYVDPTKEYKQAYRQLTHDGWMELQARLGTIVGDGNTVNLDRLEEYVHRLEEDYQGIKQNLRNNEQQYNATIARILRKQVKEARNSQCDTVSADIFDWMVDTDPSTHRTSLSSEGRSYLQYRILSEVGVDREGHLDPDALDKLIENLGDVRDVDSRKRTAENKFQALALRSLESRRKEMGTISVEESVKVSNSPWQAVILTLRSQERFANLPQAFFEKQLFPIVKKIQDEVIKFTPDSMEQDGIFHAIGDRVSDYLEEIIGTIPDGQTDHLMSRIVLSALSLQPTLSDVSVDQLNSELQSTIKIAALQERLESENPGYLLIAEEEELHWKHEVADIIWADLDRDRQQYFHNQFVERGILPRYSDRERQIVNASPDQLSERENQIRVYLIKREQEIITQYIQRISTNLRGDEDIFHQSEETHEKINELRELVHDESSLAAALEELHDLQYGHFEGEELDRVDYILGQKWLTPELRKQYESRRHKMFEQKALDKKQGQKFSAHAERERRGNERWAQVWDRVGWHSRAENLRQPGKVQQKLDKYLQETSDSLEGRYNAELASYNSEEYERRNALRLKIINGLRLVSILGGAAAGIASTLSPEQDLGDLPYVGEGHLQQSLEGSDFHQINNPDESNLFENVKEFGMDLWHHSEDVVTFFKTLLSSSNDETGFQLNTGSPTATTEGNLDRLTQLTQEASLSETEIFGTDTASDDAIPTDTSKTTETSDQDNILNDDRDAEQQLVSDAETVATPEHEETLTLPEFIFGGSVWNEFLSARLDRVEGMTPEEQTEYLAKIGGAERLNNNIICFGLLGKDSGAEGRDTEFGHADQFHGLCYDIKNNSITILTIPRHLKLPELNGVSANGITWIDQEALARGEGYQQIDREIARDVFEDAFGLPFDGVLETDMNGFSQIIDTLFPQGIDIRIEEGEGFIPDEFLAGYLNGKYTEFKDGETYNFSGTELLAFVRSRMSSAQGYFDREQRASGTMTQLLEAIADQLTRDLQDPLKAPQAILNLIRMTQDFESLEEDGSLRMTWNLEFNDPDTDQEGQKSKMFSDFMQIALMSMKDPKNLGNLIRLAAEGNVNSSLVPQFQRFQISPEATEPALEVMRHPDSGSLIFPEFDNTNVWYDPSQAAKYFAQLREFMQSRLYPEKTPPSVEIEPEETPAPITDQNQESFDNNQDLSLEG